MHIQATLISLTSLLALGSAVDFNAFYGTQCSDFKEHYHLNPGSKGNLAAERRSFYINTAEPGCHLKFYTGLNQAPNDGSALSFPTDTDNICYWFTNNQFFRSFGFYCP